MTEYVIVRQTDDDEVELPGVYTDLPSIRAAAEALRAQIPEAGYRIRRRGWAQFQDGMTGANK